jgi:hypothetical protein
MIDDVGSPPLPKESLPTLDAFDAAYGESFARTLDFSTWQTSESLIDNVGRIEAEVAHAAAQEDEYRIKIRNVIFPQLPEIGSPCRDAGVWRSSPEIIQEVHRGLLFTGGVEASDGLSKVHDTLPLMITQIGVSLVSYDGKHGAWAHRFFRRELRDEVRDPIAEIERALHDRRRRNTGRMGNDQLSDLARRGMMAYAERAALQSQSTARWRMGHGSPIPIELLTGLWLADRSTVRAALDLIAWFADFGRFVFVPSQPRRRDLLMLGNALEGGEYLIFGDMREEVYEMVRRVHYRDEYGVRTEMDRLIEEIAPKFVTGVYRASRAAPAYLFYAHANHAHTAAHLAIADAQLQETRGFPMLLDLARAVCRATFGMDSLVPLVQTAFASVDEPLRYLAD